MRQMMSFVAVMLSAVPAIAFQVPPTPQGLIAPIAMRTDLNQDCLQPLNKSTVQGTAIVQETCGGLAEQVWIIINVGNGNFHFMNALTGLCLDARGSAANKTPVQQWTCDTISNENWEVVGPAFTVTLKSKVSGATNFCLDVPGGQTTAGLGMQIYGCNGTRSQIWLINPSDAVVVPLVVGEDTTTAVNKVWVYGLTPDLKKSTSSTQCKSAHSGFVVAQDRAPGSVSEKKQVVTLTYCPQCASSAQYPILARTANFGSFTRTSIARYFPSMVGLDDMYPRT